MAHKRKDTFASAPEWWKHLRPFNKRRTSKRERVASKIIVEQASVEKNSEHEPPEGRGEAPRP